MRSPCLVIETLQTGVWNVCRSIRKRFLFCDKNMVLCSVLHVLFNVDIIYFLVILFKFSIRIS